MRSVLTLLFVTILCTCVRAQTPVTFGESHEIRSQVLDENRTLNVLLPTEYADSTQNNYLIATPENRALKGVLLQASDN